MLPAAQPPRTRPDAMSRALVGLAAACIGVVAVAALAIAAVVAAVFGAALAIAALALRLISGRGETASDDGAMVLEARRTPEGWVAEARAGG